MNDWVQENPGAALAVARYVAGERPHHEPRELVACLQVRLDVVRMLGAERTKPGEAGAVLNAEDPWAPFFAGQTRARVIRFALAGEADLRVRSSEFTLAGIRASVDSPWGRWEVASPLVGRHNLANILGAAGACLHVGLDRDAVARGVTALSAVPGRFEKVEAG